MLVLKFRCWIKKEGEEVFDRTDDMANSKQNKSVATKLFGSFFASSDLEDVIGDFNEILKVLAVNPFEDDVFATLKVSSSSRRTDGNRRPMLHACMLAAKIS